MKLPKWPEKSRAALFVLLIFFCGIVAGALATNVWLNWGPDLRMARADTPRGQSRQQRTVEKFTRELSLNPEQAQKLNHILDETRAAFHAHQQELDVIRQEGRGRIREILTDDQKAKYEHLLTRMDSRRKRRQ
ncbi:MAG: hypothetical protein A3J28_02275 [Acidobacteria bacterium RIFCSPLOWO2_12_FULL_60_22]|nr:MAG: hypothetical protein A3J28_02275 [Acidobacteria bacterium RIFCSPLOWO2_12_FULL_60_22]